jgi:hypothetical protein
MIESCEYYLDRRPNDRPISKPIVCLFKPRAWAGINLVSRSSYINRADTVRGHFPSTKCFSRRLHVPSWYPPDCQCKRSGRRTRPVVEWAAVESWPSSQRQTVGKLSREPYTARWTLTLAAGEAKFTKSSKTDERPHGHPIKYRITSYHK